VKLRPQSLHHIVETKWLLASCLHDILRESIAPQHPTFGDRNWIPDDENILQPESFAGPRSSSGTIPTKEFDR